jgi:predicted nuclease with TOPRIM domain
MKKQLEQRLKELKDEFEAGRKMLAEIEAKRTNLQETLLRISGAIQVLEEELGQQGKNGKETSIQNVVEPDAVEMSR